jgi:hypothetical protein
MVTGPKSLRLSSTPLGTSATLQTGSHSSAFESTADVARQVAVWRMYEYATLARFKINQ